MSTLASSAHLIGPGFITNETHSQSQPTSVKFRPLRVSASACASTAERTRTHHHITSPGPSSLYEILGIQTGATCQEIKTAYRKLARVLHPDVAAKSQNENSAYKFMKLHEAYETLSDPKKRADYDRTLFRRRRPSGSPFAVSGVANTMATSSNSRFCAYSRRTWETDQCW